MTIQQTVFITGAASGIGLATAHALSEQGYLVAMADLHLATLQAATQDWQQANIRLYELDVTNFIQAQQVLADFCENQPLDILINNAGVLEIGPFQSISNAQHARTLNVNVMGVINMCQTAFEYLTQARGATVINLSSASSDYGVPDLASYSASKFSVKALTEALEIEWQPHNIRVCDVLPPFVSTHMVNSQKQTSRIMQRLGVNLTAKDVVKVICKQINNPKTHRPVSFLYGLLHFLSDISPTLISRNVMKFLNRP